MVRIIHTRYTPCFAAPTNAVNSCGLDMSEGLDIPACLADVDALEAPPSREAAALDGVDAGVTLSGRAEDDGMF